MKSIFQFSLCRNLSISLQYVPSRSNPADAPLRTLSDLDALLDVRSWNLVESTFGPHTIDLMALPSNVKLDRSRCPLKFFSSFPCVQAQGTNVFSQELASSENPYVFPPFTLIGLLVKYLACNHALILLLLQMSRPENTGGPSSSVSLSLHSS